MPEFMESFRVGALDVTAISDGAPAMPLGSFFGSADEAEWTSAVGVASADEPIQFNFGVFLVRGHGRTTLIDAGFGQQAKAMGAPGGGELLDHLRSLGIEPEGVDQIVISHLHGDHIGWLVGGVEEGQLTFPNARVHLAAEELHYWISSAADENQMAGGARGAIGPVAAAGRVEPFQGETDVADGILTIPAPGHTPGHTAVLVSSNGEHLIIVGDSAHHPVHFEHHDWLPVFDLDPEASTRSRRRICELAVELNATVTGVHFPVLTLGKIERAGDGFRWVDA